MIDGKACGRPLSLTLVIGRLVEEAQVKQSACVVASKRELLKGVTDARTGGDESREAAHAG